MTCRIALTEEQRGKLNKGFKCYLDCKEDKSIKLDEQYLVCSIQSLHKVNREKYDLIVLDEIETILNSWSEGADCHKADIGGNNAKKTGRTLLIF